MLTSVTGFAMIGADLCVIDRDLDVDRDHRCVNQQPVFAARRENGDPGARIVIISGGTPRIVGVTTGAEVGAGVAGEAAGEVVGGVEGGAGAGAEEREAGVEVTGEEADDTGGGVGVTAGADPGAGPGAGPRQRCTITVINTATERTLAHLSKRKC